MDDLNIQAGVTVNAEQAERAFTALGDKAQKMANEVTKAADKAGKATDGMGDGAEKGADKFTRAESRMRSAIQKSTRELEMLGKTASQKFEAQLEFKGLDKAKFRPFLDELRKTEEAAAKARDGVSGIGDAARVAGSMMAAAFSGAALLGVVGKVVSVQREFDVLNSSLKTVTGSSAAAEREMAWLKDFAKETPFGLAQATQGFVKMKALGLDPTRAALTSFGNTASAMGKDLNQMIEAVADASTGEFERLKEFGIKAKKEGDNVSLTFQGVTTTIKNSAAEITQYLENIGNTSFGGAMEERAKTLDGTIAALGDTWDELFRTVSTNNVGGLIFDSVTLANGVLEDATTLLRAMGGAAQDASRDTGALSTIQNGIATVFETVAVLGANLKYVLVQIGNEIGGLAAQVAQAAQFNFSGVAAIRSQMVADAEAARREIDATTERILRARKAQEEYARWATRNASAAADPRRVDLGGSTARATSGGVSSGAAKAVKETISEYDKLIKKLSDELPRAAAEAEAAQMGYNKAQAEFLALAASPAWAKFTNDQRATVAALFENKIASEQSAEAAKTLAKANLDAAASREKYLTSLSTGLDKIQADIAAQIEATERMGLSKEAIAALDAAKLEMLATDLELQAVKALDRNLDQQTYDALKKQAQAYRELGAAKKGGAAKEAALEMEKANAEAAKKAQEDWERAAEQINGSLTDALLRGFESGKDFAKNLRDTVVNMFKTMVLRPVISAIVSPVAGAITGALGLAGTANAGTSALAGGGGTGGLGGLGNIASGIGNLFGGGGMGSVLDLFGATGMGALDIGGIGLGSLGSSLASGFASIAGALGPIALGIGAVMAIVKSLDKSGTPHGGALAEYSAAGGLSTSQKHGAYGMGFGGVDANDTIKSFVSGLSTSIVGILDSTAKAFGKSGGYSVATGFADDSSKDGAWGGLLIKQMENVLVNWDDSRSSKWAPKVFADGEAGQKEYLAALAKDVTGVLKEMDLPGWAQDALNALGETPAIEDLAKVIDQINATKAVFDTLGKNLVGFSGYADDATTALLKAAGGTEALASAASTYYENFYSEAERQANATRDVTDALAKVNIALPTSREEYRKLVEQYTAMGADGADTLAVLLGLSGAFAAITPAAEGATEAIQKTVEELIAGLRNPTRSNEDIARNTVGLEDKLFAAENKGNTAALRERELMGLSDNEQAILRRIHAIEDETDAAEKAAAKAAQIASERTSLEDQWLSLIGDSAALRERERAALDESNRALYDQINAERDRQAAAAEAAAAEASRATERSGIERDILSLQGDTAALRALELAGLDPANRALKEHYYALLDEANAAEAAASAVRAAAAEHASLQERLWQIEGNTGALRRAALDKLLDDESRALQQRIWDAEDAAAARAEEARANAAAAAEWQQFQQAQAAAAQAIKDAWSGVADTVLDEAKRLRGEVTGGTPQSMAQAQAAFAIATAQARAGDQDAAKQLPALSKALEEIAKKQVASSLDLWRVQTTTAASLELTAKMLAEKFGFTLPSFAVGTNYVPYDMVAQIHQGEAIVPRAYNPTLTGGMAGGNMSGSTQAELVAEVRALRLQVAALQTTADKTERNTKRASDDLDDFSRNGIPTINQPGTTLATV